ncbi:MAG: hypothetical protein AMXMBFR13_00710 [Phycisphaerae bacterium]|jgi:sigma-B regulation protein RsbU (phosphoserine phosphatase)
MARILIVEDEVSQRFVMNDLLLRSGHEALSASNPEEAIQAGTTLQPEVLVCDWLLKAGRTGLDVAEALRGRDPRLGLIFISALPSDVIESKAAHLKPFEVINKPCEFYDLLKAVHATLGDLPKDA